MGSYDPTHIKDIIVLAEDTRIALRKSEVMNQGLPKQEVERQLRFVDSLYLNLRTGQHCVRDFFICLKENLESWCDVYQIISLNMVNSTKCIGCGRINQYETNLLHIEIDVPPHRSKLNQYVENTLNGFIKVEYNCNNGCKEGAENRSMIKSTKETEFIIIILRRVIQDATGRRIEQNMTDSLHSINIRYYNHYNYIICD